MAERSVDKNETSVKSLMSKVRLVEQKQDLSLDYNGNLAVFCFESDLALRVGNLST